MSNGVNTRAVSHSVKMEMLSHSLARRPRRELEGALEIAEALLRAAGDWNGDDVRLGNILPAPALAQPKEAVSVATRCMYFEFCDEPRNDQRSRQMMVAIDQWERKLWREPGHVKLGLERVVSRLRAEIALRQHRAVERQVQGNLRRTRNR